MEERRDDPSGAVDRNQRRRDEARSRGGRNDVVDGRAGNDGDPPGAWAQAEVALAQRYSALRFFILRNAFYHSARLRHFEWQHRALMFAIVASGTAGLSGYLATYVGQSGFAAITALLATLDLVMDVRGKAQLHDSLKRRYFVLLAKIDECPEADSQQIAKWYGKAMRITAEEPVTYRIVDALAHNEATETMGLNEDEKIHVTRLQFLIRHWTAGHGMSLPYVTQWLPRRVRIWRAFLRGWNALFRRKSR